MLPMVDKSSHLITAVKIIPHRHAQRSISQVNPDPGQYQPPHTSPSAITLSDSLLWTQCDQLPHAPSITTPCHGWLHSQTMYQNKRLPSVGCYCQLFHHGNEKSNEYTFQSRLSSLALKYFPLYFGNFSPLKAIL